jgi:regulator of sigma E protease
MESLVNVAILLVLLVGLVLVHELGHFVMAKRAGVKVHEFGIGFPPRAAVLFRRGETTYTLNWLPIGGFVRLEGEEGESVDPRAFVNQGLGTRLRILLAGVVVNFVLAWIIFTFIAMFADPVFNVRVGGVLPDSPAQAAGLVSGQITGYTERQEIAADDGSVVVVEPRPIYDDSGDLIIAVDGLRFPVMDELMTAPEVEEYRYPPLRYLAERPAETVTLTVVRSDGTVEDIEATLRSAEDAKVNGALGVSGYKVPQEDTQNPVIDSVVTGFERTVQASTLVLRGVASLIESIFSGPPGGDTQVAGPVGIVSVIGELREAAPPIFMVFFVGLLSANLAVINILPFPPMDGGRITMALVQAVSRNRVTPAAERMVYLTGFVLLMALLVWVTISDISRLTG